MKRIDSGFQESPFLNPHNEPPSIIRSNTAPTHRRKHIKSIVETTQSTCRSTMESQRPGSEDLSRPLQHRSKTTSSRASTTQSRGRAHGSKPSSRRTSCTIVDPSRSRHYRIQSSHTVPTATSQDIDDVYALHHRSYSLFQNPSLHTTSGLPSPTLSEDQRLGFPGPASRFSTDEVYAHDEHDLPKKSEDTTAETAATITHWTSPCTRRREYERIDRANSGVRGFFNKVMPRCVSGPQERFYEKDKSDAGSVRRYRMDNEDNTAEEKKFARSQAPHLKKPSSSKKKWICF